MRNGNTSTVVITSANHIMVVLLPLSRSLTHQIPFLCFSNKHQSKETTPLAKINFWVEYSFVLSLLSLPHLDCCFLSSTYRQEQQTPEPLTPRKEAARSSKTSEQFHYRTWCKNSEYHHSIFIKKTWGSELGWLNSSSEKCLQHLVLKTVEYQFLGIHYQP